MSCSSCSRLCNHLVISEDVSFVDDTLLINIPQAAYDNGQMYCLLVGQDIPVETTITADVGITIGADDTTIYPLVNSNCTNVNACQIAPRVKYPTIVRTNIREGVFKLTGNLGCSRCNYNNAAPSLPLPVVAQTNTSKTNTEAGG